MSKKNSIGAVCVYCGSSNSASPAYLEAAALLGKTLASEGVKLVYGGGGVGLRIEGREHDSRELFAASSSAFRHSEGQGHTTRDVATSPIAAAAVVGLLLRDRACLH